MVSFFQVSTPLKNAFVEVTVKLQKTISTLVLVEEKRGERT